MGKEAELTGGVAGGSSRAEPAGSPERIGGSVGVGGGGGGELPVCSVACPSAPPGLPPAGGLLPLGESIAGLERDKTARSKVEKEAEGFLYYGAMCGVVVN